jgi:ABC-2 type transport system ATP-binding protein
MVINADQGPPDAGPLPPAAPAPVPAAPAPVPAAPAPVPAAPAPVLAGAGSGDNDRYGVVAIEVHRYFGAIRAVNGVSMRARKGAVTALIGPNGAGKTTLLLVLAGLLTPNIGSVRVAGLNPVTQNALARTKMGWMPDVFGTWDSLTAREVLTTFADAYRIPRDIARPRVAGLLGLVHLTEYADRPARVLSRGQKQRLGLARALVHDPEVLLLDEPASGLDPRSRVDLRHLLRDLAADGMTVVVSSHVLSELDELADDAVFISRGQTVASETMAEASSALRPWRIGTLSLSTLTAWLTDADVVWRPMPSGPPGISLPHDEPGDVLVDLAGPEQASELLARMVGAHLPVSSLAPAAGALEQAYLALDEERR